MHRRLALSTMGLNELSGLTWLQLAGLLIVALLTLCVYRRYLSPISDVPGPALASVTRLWHIRNIIKGDQNLELIRLHDQHGKLFSLILAWCRTRFLTRHSKAILSV